MKITLWKISQLICSLCNYFYSILTFKNEIIKKMANLSDISAVHFHQIFPNLSGQTSDEASVFIQTLKVFQLLHALATIKDRNTLSVFFYSIWFVYISRGSFSMLDFRRSSFFSSSGSAVSPWSSNVLRVQKPISADLRRHLGSWRVEGSAINLRRYHVRL